MAPGTTTRQLDTLYTTTWQLRRKELYDQIFNATPFFHLLMRKGKIRHETGGAFIEENLRYDKNATIKFIGRGGVVTISDTDALTVSKWDWKYLTGHIVRHFTDFQQNRGKSQLINRVQSDIDNLRDSTIDKLDVASFGDGTGDDGKAIDGLGNIVATTTTSGIVGTIDRATNPWWRNQVYSMSGEDVSIYLLKRMRNMFNTCGLLGEGVSRFPDLLVTTQTIYEAYEEEAEEVYHITDNKLADLGFGDLAFKTRPITWSPSATSGMLWFLNTNFLGFVVDDIKWLSLGDWLPIYDQPESYVAHMMSVGNIVGSCMPKQGKLHSISP